MSDTPRTDALHNALVKASEGPGWIAGRGYEDMKAHARQLERELADVRHDLERAVANHAADLSPTEDAA